MSRGRGVLTQISRTQISRGRGGLTQISRGRGGLTQISGGGVV